MTESLATQTPSLRQSSQPFGRSAVGLLSVWLILLLGGLLAARLLPDPTGSNLGTIGRLGSSIALILLAALAWLQAEQSWKWFAILIAVGMFLGTVGDFFNANQLKFIPLSDPTLGAIVAFGLGHVFYMLGIVGVLRRFSERSLGKIVGSILLWQLVGLLAWYGIVYGTTERSGLVYPALGYCLLLAGTAGLATAAACHCTSLWPLALGAALFLLSDLILAVVLFRGSFPFRSEAVWLTYGPGQMLIVASSWLVFRLAPGLSHTGETK